MGYLFNLLRRGPAAEPAPDLPQDDWTRAMFTSELAPQLEGPDGKVLVWTIRDAASRATITDQFKANADEYHRRYSASDHFEGLFRKGLLATGIAVAERPLILDIGSGSGVNSVVPCRRLFRGARIVATDLSAELLAMLAQYLVDEGASEEVCCVQMDAMSDHVAPGAFDLVTGASILHHLDSPEMGVAAAARALRPGGHAIFFEPFNGWGIVRLAFERILVEGELRGLPLDPLVDDALRRLIKDVACRSAPDPDIFAVLDDKWLFSRTQMEEAGRAAGFETVRFVAHNDHPKLYRNTAAVHLRLATGRSDLELPPWALSILESFDAAMPRDAKRELMMEGTVVMTKAR